MMLLSEMCQSVKNGDSEKMIFNTGHQKHKHRKDKTWLGFPVKAAHLIL